MHFLSTGSESSHSTDQMISTSPARAMLVNN